MTNVNKFLSINDKNLLTLFFSGVSIQVTEMNCKPRVLFVKRKATLCKRDAYL